MSAPSGKLYMIVGPSGTGKSTLARALQAEGIPEVVSHTSRAPRAGEVRGVAYNFVDRAEFERMLQAGDFIEHVEYNGNLYGVSRHAVNDALAKGDACIVVEGHGAEQLRAAYPHGTTGAIFLLPPTWGDEGKAVLRQRLVQRGDAAEVIEKRIASVDREMEFFHKWNRQGAPVELPYDQIRSTTLEEVRLQALRIVEEPRGKLRDVTGKVLKTGQKVVYASLASRSATLTVGTIKKFQRAKKVTWHRDADRRQWKIVVSPLTSTSRDRVRNKDVVLAFPTRICVIEDTTAQDQQKVFDAALGVGRNDRHCTCMSPMAGGCTFDEGLDALDEAVKAYDDAARAS